MEPFSIAILVTWLVGMLLDDSKYTEVWRLRDYRWNTMRDFLKTDLGKDVQRDFPVFGRMLFSVAIAIIAYGMTQPIVQTGTLFILAMGIVHNLCACSRTRYPFPKTYSARLVITIALSVALELLSFFVVMQYLFTSYPSFVLFYAILLVASFRFVIASVATLAISAVSRNVTAHS